MTILRSLARLSAFARREGSIARSMVVMKYSLAKLSDNLYYILQSFTYSKLELSRNFHPDIDPYPAQGAFPPRKSNILSLAPLRTIRAHTSPGYFVYVPVAASDEAFRLSIYIRSHKVLPRIVLLIVSRCAEWIG